MGSALALNLAMLAGYAWGTTGGPQCLTIPWIIRVWLILAVQVCMPQYVREAHLPMALVLLLDGVAAYVMATAGGNWTLGAFAVSCMIAYSSGAVARP